jgi:GAF domain-containing protein
MPRPARKRKSATAAPARTAAARVASAPDRAALRLDRLERLQRLTGQLSAALTPEEVAGLIIAEGFGLVPARAVLLYLESPPGTLELAQGFGVSERTAVRQRRIAVADAFPAAVAYRTGMPVWLRSQEEIVEQFPAVADSAREEGDFAAVAMPVTAAGARGALVLLFDVAREFDEEEREFVLTVARQCAQALDRAQLFAGQKKLTEQIAGLQEATAALSAAATPAQVAAATFRALARIGAREGAVFYLPAPERLELVYQLGLDAETVAAFRRVALEVASAPAEGGSRDVWLGSPEEIRARIPALEPLRSRRGDGAWALLSLAIEGRSVGALACAVAEDRRLDPADHPYATALAQQCAQALERSRAYEAQKRLAERLSALHSTAAALSGAVSPADMVEHAFRALATLGACAAELHAEDGPDRVAMLVRHGPAVGAPDGGSSIDAPTPAAEVVRTGRALWLETPEEIAARYPELEPVRRWRGEGAWAVVPLLSGGRTLGALLAAFPGPRRFDADERTFLRALAQPCAHAVERARLFEIAARQQAEADASTAVLEEIFQRAPIGLALLDGSTRYVRVNRLLAELDGAPLDAHAGKTPRDLLPGEAGEAIATLTRKVLDSGEPVLDVGVVGETAAAPGTTRRWIASFYPVRVGGKIVGVGLMMRDGSR